MTLINTNGMSFIGPGSEWFWAALSGIVTAVTLLAIYRQLRLQRDAAATEEVNSLLNEWSSERMARAKLAVLLALESGTDPLDLPDRAISHVGFFLQRVGSLAQRGHMDRRVVYEHLGGQIQDWWAWLRPRVLAEREGDHDPALWQGFEWLAEDAAARDAQRGVRKRGDAERLKALPSFVEHFQQAIELEEALRAVPIRPTSTPIRVTIIRPEHMASAPTDVADAGRG